MNLKTLTTSLLAVAITTTVSAAHAVPVRCSANTSINHMSVENAIVSECLGSGTGNLTGEAANDLFLNSAAGAGYSPVTKSDDLAPLFGLSADSTSFSLDASFWGTWTTAAIGFKFGTGQNSDSWFVYELKPQTTGGDFTFNNVCPLGLGCGGGLSHVNLYGGEQQEPNDVPEPGSLALLGAGLLGLGASWRRRSV